jgi:putative peptidoglycan lipid II flippase
MTATIRRAFQNVADLLTKEQTEILKTAALLMLPSLLSKILGQVYFMLVSTQLGNDSRIGDFNTASAIPETLSNILLLGVVSAVVIPVFIEAQEKHGRERFLHIFNTMINIVMTVFLLATVLLLFFGPQMLSLFTDLSTYPGDKDNVLRMMQFLMIPNFILGLSMFITSGLNVFHRILVPQLAPLVFNIGKIFSVLILLPLMDNSPWALVIGVLIGSILHLVIQIPLSRYLGIYYRPYFDMGDEYVHKIFKLAIPRGVAFAAEQFGVLYSKSVATGVTLLRGGEKVTAITVLGYANSLALVIPTVIGYSFAVASFPTISKLFTNKEHEKIGKIIADTLNEIFFLCVPLTVILVILRLPAVRLTYGLLPGTRFFREDTIMVAWILLFMGLGLVFTTAEWYLFRVFYAAKNTFTPLVISVVSLGVTVASTILFTNLLSHSKELTFASIQWSLENFLTRGGGEAAAAGPAIGLSVAGFFEFFVLLAIIHIRLVKIDFKYLVDGLLRKAVPTVAMSTLMYFMFKTWDYLSFPIDATPGFAGSTTVNLIMLTGITILTSLMVYFLLCYLFQVSELKILRKILNPLFKLGGLHISE